MTATHPTTAPVLSTPESHIFEDPTPSLDVSSLPKLSDEQVAITYEIERTIREIREGQWKRIALQFPDQMLVDAPRVYRELARGLKRERERARNERVGGKVVEGKMEVNGQWKGEVNKLETDVGKLDVGDNEDWEDERLCILGDTSYGACCVDEIAAEHVDAQVVVHYGRSCLSPTARLPVIYVFTERQLDIQQVVDVFRETYKETEGRIVLMADIPYASHIPRIHGVLKGEGYTATFATEIIHDPSSALPNRTVPAKVAEDVTALRDYQLFHIGPPPTALLLTLSSRVGAIHICDINAAGKSSKATLANSSLTLRRRYALLTSLSATSVYGILINTLSVKNYLSILSQVQAQILAAGKKSYTFVVGKINAAKIANFAEIGGWVVIGCWESSLVESRDFFRPVITPFELGLALQDDGERVWTGEWEGDFERVLKKGIVEGKTKQASEMGDPEVEGEIDSGSESESAPPEFDLRTGRYVSHSRPMRTTHRHGISQGANDGEAAASRSQSLVKRANGDLAQVGGVVSPGAEFLRTARTWQGLGSDFEIKYDEENSGSVMEEGRSGIARGYVVGEKSDTR